MKKIVSLFLCLMILNCALALPAANAESIAEMTFDQLIELRRKINLELFSRPEWQEVTVPQGVYRVGEDIPAGTWTVKCSSAHISDRYSASYCTIEWGQYLDEDGQSISWKGYCDYAQISHPDSKYYEGEMTEYTFTVKNGDYIIIGGSSNAAVFTTYIGKPDLGFKW